MVQLCLLLWLCVVRLPVIAVELCSCVGELSKTCGMQKKPPYCKEGIAWRCMAQCGAWRGWIWECYLSTTGWRVQMQLDGRLMFIIVYYLTVCHTSALLWLKPHPHKTTSKCSICTGVSTYNCIISRRSCVEIIISLYNAIDALPTASFTMWTIIEFICDFIWCIVTTYWLKPTRSNWESLSSDYYISEQANYKYLLHGQWVIVFVEEICIEGVMHMQSNFNVM